MKTKAEIMNERISNGDIFADLAGVKNKQRCLRCEAITDGDNDKYCWKCGLKLNHLDNTQTHRSN